MALLDGLIRLPEEILEEILQNLDVCAHLKTVIKASPKLIYKIELTQAGMVDNPLIKLSYSERLAKLRRRCRAWDNLDWQDFSITVTGLCHAYELVNGAFMKLILDHDFIVARLPSVNVPRHEIRRHDLDIRAPAEHKDFWLHVRSFTNHEAHPLARLPVLEFSVYRQHGTWVQSLVIEIAGDVVAEGSIQVHAFRSEQGAQSIQVATLLLPELEATAQIISFSNHTGPFETPPSDELFATAPTARIHVLSISYLAIFAHNASMNFRLYVHNNTFLSFLNDELFNTPLQNAEFIPWSSWGPKTTRMIPVGLVDYRWLRYVHGERVVLPVGASGHKDTVEVLNFNRDSSRNHFDPPSTVIEPGIFKEAVVTELPYTRTSRKISGDFFAFMIDAQRIIALKAEDDEEVGGLHVFAL
ncbi:hypothetical protein H0H81_012316 [Sphagnurus paluster]|uniref:F-box domain-containing protein n=1 Tax=Sphagnurus paluster TaxID=117069 RepID=A0A9P7GN95_9AGAR|nr:hypothetical protein H0H81_012316 [Sphagnurus paluster]